MTASHEIVPMHLAIQSMRDNGYKNAAYALAELIDNSIEAEASKITVICEEKIIHTKRMNILDKIYVLDNGTGMTPDVLRMSLQFGNGTRLEQHLQKGIGKYGMGLPNSSISQCTRVEVYSWQDGPDSVFHTYLDVDEIRAKNQAAIPEPVQKNLPDNIIKLNLANHVSGTLVVWSNLDRLQWKRASTLIKNSEALLGRLYRKFIYKKKAEIRLISFVSHDPENITENKIIKPNDPIYLMEETSCPEPFHNKAMFEPFQHSGESHSVTHHIRFQGKMHPVTLHFTVSKDEARNTADGADPGSKGYGKHADKNKGISVVRADREIELDTSWCNSYEPTERWWGVEIEFSSELDELFGLTNNKQNVRYFSDMLDAEFEEEPELSFKEISEKEEQMESLDDPRLPFKELKKVIKSNLSQMRKHIKSQRENTRSKRNSESVTADSPEMIGTKATEEFRREEGIETQSDKEAKSLSVKKQTEMLKSNYKEKGMNDEDATKMAKSVIKSGSKYVFISKQSESYAFFSIESRAGVIHIVLNSQHPAYDKLLDLTIEQDLHNLSEAELTERLERSRDALKLVLEAWACFEDETLDDTGKKEKIQEFRQEWGKRAKKFLSI